MVAEADDRRLLVAMLAATGWLAGTRGVAARDDPFLFDGNALLRRTGSVMAAQVDPGFISTDVDAGLTLELGRRDALRRAEIRLVGRIDAACRQPLHLQLASRRSAASRSCD